MGQQCSLLISISVLNCSINRIRPRLPKKRRPLQGPLTLDLADSSQKLLLNPFSRAEQAIENTMVMLFGCLTQPDQLGSTDLYRGTAGLIHWVYQNLSNIYSLTLISLIRIRLSIKLAELLDLLHQQLMR